MMNKEALFIACAGRKGGSGKTAVALGLAACFARKGARVLLVDLDPQGSASLALGADADGEALAGTLDGTAAPVMVTIDTFTGCPPMSLLSGGPALERVDAAGDLRRLLAGIAADVVLMDCPPGHRNLDRLALQAAAVALACCEPHRMGIAGAARVLDEAADLARPPQAALVLCRVDARRSLDRAAPDLLAGAFAVPVFHIRQDARLAAALNAGTLPGPDGTAAADLEALACWIEKQNRRGTP
jgi:chromosome partitioning protein